MTHKAQAIALTCIDFRFRKALHDFFENELNLYAVDHKADAGGVKQLVDAGPIQDWILKNFQISFDLHHVEKVILINHQDCGAYGGSQAFATEAAELEFHENVLRHAASIVKSKFPDKEVEAFLALLKGEDITFKKIV